MHNQTGLSGANADRFRGLQSNIFLAVGARVFMASNVWTAVGLANGAQGEAVHMQWSPGRAPTALTEVVFVRIAGYSGPSCFNETHVTIGDERIDLRNVVPVGSIEASDDQPPAARRSRGGAQGPGHTCCLRTQLPFMLSFGITHHKSQGTRRPRCVGYRQHRAKGLPDLHGLEPVPRIDGMLLEDFALERFLTISTGHSFSSRLADLDRMRAFEDRTRIRCKYPS